MWEKNAGDEGGKLKVGSEGEAEEEVVEEEAEEDVSCLSCCSLAEALCLWF